MKNQDRYRSGRFRVTTFVCGYCGVHSQGARSRDLHDAGHMLIRPRWYKREVAR